MTGESTDQADQEALNRLLIALLENMEVPYAIGGSLAAMSYSEPRYTRDIDLMFQAEMSVLADLVNAVDALDVHVDPLDTIIEFNLPRQMPSV